jgi:hypothetical protein
MARHRKYSRKRSLRRNKRGSRKMRGGIYTPENSVASLSVGDLNNSDDDVPFEVDIEEIPQNEEHYLDDDGDLNESSYEHSFDDSLDPPNNTTFESQRTLSTIGSIPNSPNTTIEEEEEVSFGGKRRRKRRRTNKRKTRKSKKTRKNKKRRQRGGIIL